MCISAVPLSFAVVYILTTKGYKELTRRWRRGINYTLQTVNVLYIHPKDAKLELVTIEEHENLETRKPNNTPYAK